MLILYFLQTHINTTHLQLFDCELCSTQFPSAPELSKHMQNDHPKLV